MAKTIKKLILKNYYLIGNAARQVDSLQEWLSKQMLHGKVSRHRTRFLKLIVDRVNEIDVERQEMLKENAVTKKVGKEDKIVYFDKDRKETTNPDEGKEYKMKDEKAFQETYLKYINEEFVIDVTPSTSETIYGVRDLLLNTDEAFSGVMAARYDEWVLAFENIA